MSTLLVASTVAASLVLLGRLKWVAVVLGARPAERRPRRVGRAGPGGGTPLPQLVQLERLAEEALAGDRLAVGRLALLAASASRRGGVPVAEAEAAAVASPAQLLAALDRWEGALAALRGGRPHDSPIGDRA
jgi:hypothetical protein